MLRPDPRVRAGREEEDQEDEQPARAGRSPGVRRGPRALRRAPRLTRPAGYFIHYLTKKGYEGKTDFDHDKLELNVSVNLNPRATASQVPARRAATTARA